MPADTVEGKVPVVTIGNVTSPAGVPLQVDEYWTVSAPAGPGVAPWRSVPAVPTVTMPPNNNAGTVNQRPMPDVRMLRSLLID